MILLCIYSPGYAHRHKTIYIGVLSLSRRCRVVKTNCFCSVFRTMGILLKVLSWGWGSCSFLNINFFCSNSTTMFLYHSNYLKHTLRGYHCFYTTSTTLVRVRTHYACAGMHSFYLYTCLC